METGTMAVATEYVPPDAGAVRIWSVYRQLEDKIQGQIEGRTRVDHYSEFDDQGRKLTVQITKL